MTRSHISLPLILALFLAATASAADTGIHRCLLEDGTVAFQEMPCTEPAATADGGTASGENGRDGNKLADDAFDFVNPFDEVANPPVPSEPVLPELPSADRADCEKETRDAIDAIDLEMRETTYSKEQGQVYLAELLILTRQLRACKQL